MYVSEYNARTILESKNMGAIFGKRAKYLEIWAKKYKIGKYFEKRQVIAFGKLHAINC